MQRLLVEGGGEQPGRGLRVGAFDFQPVEVQAGLLGALVKLDASSSQPQTHEDHGLAATDSGAETGELF